MKFETARVCVQRRTVVPPADLIESNPFAEPEFNFEVVAWPPGEVDGGMLPQIGDVLTLPGYAQAFRIVDRALHWPAPTSAEARRGEIRVDLIVEEEQAAWAASRPGRPGEDQIREDGRWLEGEVTYFEIRRTRTDRDSVHIQFRVDGVGHLGWFMTRNFQAAQLFPAMTGLNSGDDEGFIIPAEVFAHLALGQRFDLRVGPDQFGHTAIREVRPQRDPEPEPDESNTWAAEGQELTDEIWGQN